jgi:hypothetical protein
MSCRRDKITMTAASDVDDGRKRVGLCADCLHAKKIQSDRGSEFILCQLSATDANFPRYPRLPILQCPGYERSVGTRSSEDG